MLDISKIKALAEMLEDIVAVSNLENKGPMYAGQHIRSGLVRIGADTAAGLLQGAKDIRELAAEMEQLRIELAEEVSRRYQAECNYDHAVADRDANANALAEVERLQEENKRLKGAIQEWKDGACISQKNGRT